MKPVKMSEKKASMLLSELAGDSVKTMSGTVVKGEEFVDDAATFILVINRKKR